MKNVIDVHVEGSLVDFVITTLEEQGHPDPTDWCEKLHPDALEVEDPNVQRFLINRTLRTVLGSHENTIDARFCLVDTGNVDDWARLFKTAVAKRLVEITKE
jgi:hypothetical protein